jgi:hypothetical protein
LARALDGVEATAENIAMVREAIGRWVTVGSL